MRVKFHARVRNALTHRFKRVQLGKIFLRYFYNVGKLENKLREIVRIKQHRKNRRTVALNFIQRMSGVLSAFFLQGKCVVDALNFLLVFANFLLNTRKFVFGSFVGLRAFLDFLLQLVKHVIGGRRVGVRIGNRR